MKKGIFTISLDFELHWGGFEKWPEAQYQQYFLNTRQLIPEKLALFVRYGARATWATVGMLMHASKEALEHNRPSLEPSYQEAQLSAYHYIAQRGIGNTEAADPLHYAASLVDLIVKTEGQELASHTFAHYYCNEAGQQPEQFRADLKAAQKAAALWGRHLQSLVFPRNQYNEACLRIAFEEGIRVVRTNPVDWFWKIDSTQHEGYWKRLNRGLSAYFPLGSKNTFPLSQLQRREHYPVELPASRLFRPYRPKEVYLNQLKVQRICQEMSQAARLGEVYHLWWHPHNFGHYPDQNMAQLEQVLQHFRLCHEKYGMQAMTMDEIEKLL